VTEKEWVSL